MPLCFSKVEVPPMNILFNIPLLVQEAPNNTKTISSNLSSQHSFHFVFLGFR